MKTRDRKKLLVHHYPKCCSNCDYYIYTDQEYITVGTGYNSKQWFHKDYTGCQDSQFLPIVRTNRSKEGPDPNLR